MEKQKSTNLHDFEHQLFLGFIAQQPLKSTQIEGSFIGGQPLWLYEPNEKLLVCNDCSSEGQTLTFLGQIFCPLNAPHCYNRIMYLFYCQHCRRTFTCLKQQTPQTFQPYTPKSPKNYKSISPQPFQIESDSIQRKQLLKIMNRAKIQVEEQIILQQEGENDEDEEEGEEVVTTVERLTGEEMMNKMGEMERAKRNKQYTEKEIEEINKRFQALKMQDKEQKDDYQTKQISGAKKDHIFEQYIRIIKQLNNPVMIYSNIPIPYNKSTLNPKHTCKHCGNKLELEIQLTEKVLLFSKSLAMLDWGSVFVYACTASCKESEEESVVTQYEFDAVSEEEIARLKKTKKNRKKNKNKSLSKEKRNIQKQNEGKKIELKTASMSKQENEKEESSEGDWD